MSVMHSLWQSFKKFLIPSPYTGIILVWFIVVLTNFPWGVYFTGWDNLHPELNLYDNIYRALSGVWQAHQGVGHTGGHGYSATLLHSLFIGLLSLFFPDWSLRSIFTFLMLLVGSLGTISFTQFLTKDKTKSFQHLAMWSSGLYYLLSLGTVQQFYIQLEAFIVHFAFLPWLLLTFFYLLEKRNRKTFIQFLLVNVLATPMGFIPPLFIVYIMILTILSLGWIITQRTIESIKTVVIAGCIVVCVNAFWLFPLAHYSITRSNEYLNSYNNITSTPEFIEKNKKYGTIEHVSILRGLYFDSRDSVEQGISFLIFESWDAHLRNPVVSLLGYISFAIIVLGAGVTLLKKYDDETNVVVKRRLFFIVSLVCFTGLATNIPIFAQASDFLREYVPVFKQAFRIAFTKLSISVLLCYAVFFGVGIACLVELILKKKNKVLHSMIFAIPLLFFIVYSFPIFQGSFLYKNAQHNIPQAYFDLISFMKTQNRNERIANFAQGWRTGWVIYNWGYSGSGFLWYGIPQPILDRSFDVWSPYNENYYWQVSRAIYRKDFAEVKKILTKYNVTWVLLDPNARPYESVKEPLSYDFLKASFDSDSDFVLTQSFSRNNSSQTVLPLLLYRFNKATSLVTNIDAPSVGPTYSFTDSDTAYNTFGNYVTTKENNIYYPFRSLFNGRNGEELFFPINEEDENLVIETTLPKKQGIVKVKEAFSLEPYISAQLSFVQDATSSALLLQYLPPKIALNNKLITKTDTIQTILRTEKAERVELFINGNLTPVRLTQNQTESFMLRTNAVNIIDTDVNDNFQTITIRPPSLDTFLEDIEVSESTINILNISIPKAEGTPYTSNKDPLWSSNTEHVCSPVEPRNQPFQQFINNKWIIRPKDNTECISFYLPELPQRSGYIARFTTSFVGQLPARFFTLNEETKRADIAIPIPKNPTKKSYWIPISPQMNDGIGYSFKFLVFPSVTGQQKLTLDNFSVWPFPWTGLVSLKLITKEFNTSNTFSIQSENKHTGYIRTNVSPNIPYIALNQGFDNGWKAYEVDSKLGEIFPFLFGNELKDHVLVNNWANGWEIPQSNTNKTIVLFFLPQLLQWFGFLLIPLPFVVIFWSKK